MCNLTGSYVKSPGESSWSCHSVNLEATSPDNLKTQSLQMLILTLKQRQKKKLPERIPCLELGRTQAEDYLKYSS